MRIAALVLFVAMAPLRVAFAAAVFGHIEFVHGTVKLVDDKGQSRIAHRDDAIDEGDTFLTGPDGEVHVRTEDHGMIAVRPNSKLRVDAYRAQGDKDDKSSLSLVSGSFRSITGWIGKFNSANYSIKTPSATIGIKGTDHEPLVIPEPAPGERSAGTPGTYDKVNSGSTVLQNAVGKVAIGANSSGFAPHDGRMAPRTLDKIPHFYRASPFEDRVEKRKPDLETQAEHEHKNRQKQGHRGPSRH